MKKRKMTSYFAYATRILESVLTLGLILLSRWSVLA